MRISHVRVTARRAGVSLCALFAVALPAAAGAHTDGSAGARPGPVGGIVRSKVAPAQPTAAPASTPNAIYHGGPVMRTNTVYAIFWQPAGTSVSAGYQSLLMQYFTDVAASSGATDNVYSNDTQYYDTTGPIAHTSAFAGTYVDTATPIPQTCKGSYGGSVAGCVTEAEEQQEILHVLEVTGWTPSPTTLFFLFTPQNVGSCVDFGGESFCAYEYFCAYHSTFDTTVAGSTQPVIWANQPYPTMTGFPADVCDSGEHPNGDVADATINVVSHEHIEAITDPDVSTGWYDNSGAEISDKCAWYFGDPLGQTANGAYNEVIGSGKYWLQQEWSNGLTGCLQRPPSPLAASVSSFNPSRGGSGAKVTIYGYLVDQATDVRFGDASASFSVVGPTQIVAEVPGDATTGPITVKTPAGDAVSDFPFIVVPTITGVSTLSGKVGDLVMIGGTSLTGTSAVKFGAVADPDFSVISPNQIHAHVPEGAVTGLLSLVTDAGVLKFRVFKVLPTLDPLATTAGAPGATVTITGKTLDGAIKVAFGASSATTPPLTVKSGVITVKVPANAVTGPITVTTPGGSTDTAESFTVLSKVTSFSPSSGVAGTAVTINGSGLAGTSVALFNGAASTPTLVSGTKVIVPVPGAASAGLIRLVLPGGALTVGTFKPLPKLTSVGPLPARAGDNLTILGTNLLGTTSLKLGGTTLPVLLGVAPTQVLTKLPLNGLPSLGSVTVKTATGSASLSLHVSPTISSISPASGLAGATVTIVGLTLQGPTKVTFGSATATASIKSSGATKITVAVPASAVAGPISVTTPGGTTTSAASFVPKPRISGFSPGSGHVGQLVKIKGSGLHDVVGVTFGGVAAVTVTTVSATEVDAVVPAGASTGKIVVSTASDSATSTGTFTVT